MAKWKNSARQFLRSRRAQVALKLRSSRAQVKLTSRSRRAQTPRKMVSAFYALIPRSRRAQMGKITLKWGKIALLVRHERTMIVLFFKAENFELLSAT